MTCEQTETLLAQLASGDTTGNEDLTHLAEAEAHVAACDRCREKLADYRITLKLLSDAFASEDAASGVANLTLSPERRENLLKRLSSPLAAELAHTGAPVAEPDRFNIRNYLRPLGVAASFGLVALGAWGLVDALSPRESYRYATKSDPAVATVIESNGTLIAGDSVHWSSSAGQPGDEIRRGKMSPEESTRSFDRAAQLQEQTHSGAINGKPGDDLRFRGGLERDEALRSVAKEITDNIANKLKSDLVQDGDESDYRYHREKSGFDGQPHAAGQPIGGEGVQGQAADGWHEGEGRNGTLALGDQAKGDRGRTEQFQRQLGRYGNEPAQPGLAGAFAPGSEQSARASDAPAGPGGGGAGGAGPAGRPVTGERRSDLALDLPAETPAPQATAPGNAPAPAPGGSTFGLAVADADAKSGEAPASDAQRPDVLDASKMRATRGAEADKPIAPPESELLGDRVVASGNEAKREAAPPMRQPAKPSATAPAAPTTPAPAPTPLAEPVPVVAKKQPDLLRKTTEESKPDDTIAADPAQAPAAEWSYADKLADAKRADEQRGEGLKSQSESREKTKNGKDAEVNENAGAAIPQDARRVENMLRETEQRLEELTTEAASSGKITVVSDVDKPLTGEKQGLLGLDDTTYKSTGIIQIQPIMPKLLYTTEQNNMLPKFDSFIESQVKQIVSDRITEQAMQHEAIKKLGDKAPKDLATLRANLAVTHPGRSEFIVINYKADDPEVAQAVVKAVTETYARAQGDGDAAALNDRLDTLEQRRNQLRKELNKQRERERAEVDAESDTLPAASNFVAMPVNPFVMTERDRQSTFGLDTDTASYALSRKYVRAGFRPPAGAVRMEEFVNAFDYNYPTQSERTFTVHAEAGAAPYGEGLALVKIGVKAKTVGRDARKPAHLVFVIDASGSMDRPDRLPLVKHSLGMLVRQLGPEDRVSIVAYGTHPVIATEGEAASNHDELLTTIGSIQAGGSTNMIDALAKGYDVARNHFEPGHINRVILCSDGVANVGATDAQQILDKVAANRRQGITLTNVGFGIGGYNDALMTDLAKKGDGNYVFVDTAAEAKRLFVDNLASTLQTVAKDAKIQVEFDPARVRRYRLIGYERRDIADKDFRNDAVDAGEVGSGQSATALYEVELLGKAGDANLPDLGTVFIRYRNADTSQIEEISYRLSNDLVRERTMKGDPRFHLAAGAAEYAELLRGSEHASEGSLDRVEQALVQVVEQLPLDRNAAELLELVRQSKGLPAAP